MKKIILLILMIFVLVSCNNNKEKVQVKKYYETVKIQTGSIEEQLNYV
jgi:uncharacterized lipoprotein NlpE involved in copper resistance